MPTEIKLKPQGLQASDIEIGRLYVKRDTNTVWCISRGQGNSFLLVPIGGKYATFCETEEILLRRMREFSLKVADFIITEV